MKRLILLLLALTMLLSSCAPHPENHIVAATLPPADSPFDAPQDDSALAYTASVPLYLPSRDGQRLIVQYADAPLRHDTHPAQTILRTLLAYPDTDDTLALGGNTRLAFYGDMPVEVSGGVCTVNLASSALQLDRDDLYTVCLAIASTLGELPDVEYTNVLIAGQAVAMDISGCLPLGSISPRPGEELPVLWEQMDARRTPLGQDPGTVPVSATATLYFPLTDGSGVVCETRALSFPGQKPQQLALELVNALSAGAQFATDAAPMPNLTSLLTLDPIVSDLEDGGRLLTLRFNQGLEEKLRIAGIDLACFVAAMHRTMVTFVPSVSAVRVYVGDTLLTSLYNRQHGSLLFPEGVIFRHHFDQYLMRHVIVYMAQGKQLQATTRGLHHTQADSLRALITLLMAGPSADDTAQGLIAPLPGGLTQEDVLGLAIIEDTLLINLSDRFAQAIRESDTETLNCYCIVNTLCQATGLERVRFFFGGEPVETLAGSLYWRGEFLHSPGLIH